VSNVPPKDPFEQKPTSGEKAGERRDENQHSPSADFAALIHAVKIEGAAYRREEQREDRGKKFREWITIGLIIFTVIGVYWQIYEMIHVYGPIRDQAIASGKAADAATKQSENSDKALIQAQRAWVGPRNAAFAAEPAVGKPIEITMEYQSSGHEPALAFIYAIDPFLATTDDDTNGIVAAKLQNYAMSCKNTREWQGGSVIYPTTGGFGGGYTLSVKTKDDFVDEPLTKGEKFLLLQGCFLYQTFDAPRHSYFCYFYKQGFTRIQNLNICLSGHHAD
jgi:hypothetical protein